MKDHKANVFLEDRQVGTLAETSEHRVAFAKNMKHLFVMSTPMNRVHIHNHILHQFHFPGL